MCSGVITHVCGCAVSRTAVALSRVHRRLPGLTALNAVAAAGGAARWAVADVGSWPSGDEASRQMGQGSRADLLALVATTPHSARASPSLSPLSVSRMYVVSRVMLQSFT